MIFNDQGNLALHIMFITSIVMAFVLVCFFYWNRKNVVKKPIGLILDTGSTAVIDLSNTCNSTVVDVSLVSMCHPKETVPNVLNQAIYEILRSRHAFINKPRIIFSSRVPLSNLQINSISCQLEKGSALQALYEENTEPSSMLKKSINEPYEDRLEEYLQENDPH